VVAEDLIFDIGLDMGEDTEFYLAKGFRVVAVDANPGACTAVTQRYESEMAAGRLTIVNAAVSAQQDSVSFHVCTSNTAWSTTSAALRAHWEAEGAVFTTIRVPTITADELVSRFGVPHYAKIDVEADSLLCLYGFSREATPTFMSIEIDFYRLDELFYQLGRLGYEDFAIVNQLGVPEQRPPNPAREGAFADRVFTTYSSGLFGRELPARWTDAETAYGDCQKIIWHYRLRKLLPNWQGRWFPLGEGWFDLHAAK
jgi:FkbM family methyltransferase